MKCEHMVEAGAYVLGALVPCERAVYEQHLTDCPHCREEVADLAVLPGLMARVNTDTVISLDLPEPPAPAHLLGRTLQAAAGEHVRAQRRWRWRVGAGIAAVGLAVAIGLAGAIAQLSQDPEYPPVVAQMIPVDPTVPVSALMGYSAAAGGGTNIQMLCLYRKKDNYGAPWTLRLVVYPRGSGNPQTLSTWLVRPGTDTAVTSHTNLAPDQIDRIELTRTDSPPGSQALLVYQTT